MVYLVGAGPGDPGLLTLRGLGCLEKADLVLYDEQVDSHWLSLAPRRAERVCLGRQGGDRPIPEEEINARLVAAARSGRIVVRLQGGEMAVSGQAAKEISALEAAGIPYEMIPGVPAGRAGGGLAEIPRMHSGPPSPVSPATERRPENPDTARPLSGRRVLVTRPAGRADSLMGQLEALGAEVFRQPAIEILPPADWETVDRAIERIDEFDWVVFSSANGVRFFLDRLLRLGHDARRLGEIRLATIGPATARTLAQYHLHADCQPGEYRAEALAGTLAADAKGRNYLLVRASRGREVLAETLRAAGGTIQQVVVYRSRDTRRADPRIVQAVADGRIDWVTVTSPAIARSLVGLFGERLRRTKLVAISPLTAEVLTQAGYPPRAVATEYTSEGIVEAMVSGGL